MSEVLDSECLKVNSLWQPIDVIRVRKAFEDMASEQGLAIYFEKLDAGYWPTLKTLEEWLELAPGEDSLGVSSSGTHEPRNIRVPRVILTVNYGEVRTEEQKLTLARLARHY